MTTTASEITESGHTIYDLLEEVAALRAQVSRLNTEIKALQLDRFILAPAVIVEEKLRMALQFKDRLDSDIARLEVLKSELQSRGYRW